MGWGEKLFAAFASFSRLPAPPGWRTLPLSAKPASSSLSLACVPTLASLLASCVPLRRTLAVTHAVEDHLQTQTLTDLCRVPFVHKSRSRILEIRARTPWMGLERTHMSSREEPAIRQSQSPCLQGDPGIKEEGNTISRALSYLF